MSAMLSTTPSQLSSGCSDSLASSTTSSACSTPWAKYSATRDQRVIGRDERVDREQPERRRAVDQHEVVLALDVSERPPQGELAAHLATEDQLRFGQAEVGRQHAVVLGVDGPGLARQHVGDGGRGVGRHVEVVGEVALRVEVHTEHVEPIRVYTSARLRTAVVFPVPPFWERTVIVVAVGSIAMAARSDTT